MNRTPSPRLRQVPIPIIIENTEQHQPHPTNSPPIPPPLSIPTHDDPSVNPSNQKHKLQLNKIFGAKLFKKRSSNHAKKDEDEILEHSSPTFVHEPLEHRTIGNKGKSTSNLSSNFIQIRTIADHYMMKDKPHSKKMVNAQQKKKKKDGPSLGHDDRDIFTDSYLQDRRHHQPPTVLAAPIPHFVAQPMSKTRITQQQHQLNSELDELGDDPTENDLQTTTVSEFSEDHSHHSDHTTSTGRRHHLQQIMQQQVYHVATPLMEDITEDSSDMFDPDSLIDDEFTFRSSVGGTAHIADMSSPDFDRELDQLDSIRWNMYAGDNSITVQYSPRKDSITSITSMTTRATSNTITNSE
jgi:hypothetical protein